MSAFDQVVGRIEAKDFTISERLIKICWEYTMCFYCYRTQSQDSSDHVFSDI